MAKPGSKRGSGTAGSGAAETRAALIRGAIGALSDVGYAGASAREIAAGDYHTLDELRAALEERQHHEDDNA